LLNLCTAVEVRVEVRRWGGGGLDLPINGHRPRLVFTSWPGPTAAATAVTAARPAAAVAAAATSNTGHQGIRGKGIYFSQSKALFFAGREKS